MDTTLKKNASTIPYGRFVSNKSQTKPKSLNFKYFCDLTVVEELTSVDHFLHFSVFLMS